ncbi:MAG TPA: hypothetical protein VGM47_04745 [Gammaproteobacteria bacterium]|jgi:hypothetical protein
MALTRMQADDSLATDGSVMFRAVKLPQWPPTCVVCGQACSEVTELYSVVEVDVGTRLAHDIRGIRSFQVPVHATVKDCRVKLLHPRPFRAYFAPVLFGLAVGACMGFIAKPDWNDRMGAFTIFGVLAGFIAWGAVQIIIRPALEIRELGGADYLAGFKDQSYAQRFAELNRDIIIPIQRPSWDIDIFPRRKG